MMIQILAYWSVHDQPHWNPVCLSLRLTSKTSLFLAKITKAIILNVLDSDSIRRMEYDLRFPLYFYSAFIISYFEIGVSLPLVVGIWYPFNGLAKYPGTHSVCQLPCDVVFDLCVFSGITPSTCKAHGLMHNCLLVSLYVLLDTRVYFIPSFHVPVLESSCTSLKHLRFFIDSVVSSDCWIVYFLMKEPNLSFSMMVCVIFTLFYDCS